MANYSLILGNRARRRRKLYSSSFLAHYKYSSWSSSKCALSRHSTRSSSVLLLANDFHWNGFLIRTSSSWLSCAYYTISLAFLTGTLPNLYWALNKRRRRASPQRKKTSRRNGKSDLRSFSTDLSKVQRRVWSQLVLSHLRSLRRHPRWKSTTTQLRAY